MTDTKSPSRREQVRLGSPFAALWSATAVSTFGDGIRMAALPLLAATTTSDPTAVAVVAAAGQLPWLLTSLPGGVLADRLDRRRLMWVIDTCRAVLVAALALLVVRGDLAIAQLCAVAFLLGAGQTLFDNAGHAILPQLVPRNALMTANGRLASVRTVMLSFLGPPAGAAIFALSPPAPFLVDAVTFVLAALAVAVFIRSPANGSQRDRPRRSFWADIGEGMRWVAKDSVLRSVAVLIAIVNFTQAATQGILVLYALQQLGLGKGAYGLLLMASGVGGTLGGLLIGWVRRAVSPGTLFATAILVTVPIFAVMAITSSPWVAGLMLMLNAFAGVSAGVLLQTIRQSIVPGNLLARVNSNMQLIGVGIGLPLGSITGGLLADAFGLRAPFAVAAALIAATAVTVPSVSRALNRVSRAEETRTTAQEKSSDTGDQESETAA